MGIEFSPFPHFPHLLFFTADLSKKSEILGLTVFLSTSGKLQRGSV